MPLSSAPPPLLADLSANSVSGLSATHKLRLRFTEPSADCVLKLDGRLPGLVPEEPEASAAPPMAPKWAAVQSRSSVLVRLMPAFESPSSGAPFSRFPQEAASSPRAVNSADSTDCCRCSCWCRCCCCCRCSAARLPGQQPSIVWLPVSGRPSTAGQGVALDDANAACADSPGILVSGWKPEHLP